MINISGPFCPAVQLGYVGNTKVEKTDAISGSW